MQLDTSKLNVGEIELVQWQYGGLGGFKKALWSAIEQADLGHLTLLSKSFPDQVTAYSNYSHTPGYWVDVLTRAGLYNPPTTEGNTNAEDKDDK